MRWNRINIVFHLFFAAFASISNLVSAQIVLTESHLPIFIIDTQNQTVNDSVKIAADMKVYFNENGGINNINGSEPHYEGKIGLEYRGSSSLLFPKKSFNLETRDEFGNNRNFPLLGFPSENDWVLYAPYSDKTLMRNVLAYNLFAKMGHYSPRTAYCELIFNGNYRGVYVFMEKIKRDKKRVNIAEQEGAEGDSADLTGGYILQIDRDDNSGWYSSIIPSYAITNYTYYQIIYPNNANTQQLNYIKKHIDDFEHSFDGNNILSLINGIDLNSFIDVVIINEIAKNVDAYRLSTFFFKDNDSIDRRLRFGPIWDFNIAFGNVEYYLGDKTSDWQMHPPFIDAFMPPYWIREIFIQPVIQNKLKQRWQELIGGFLAADSINSLIDEQVSLLGEAVQRNFSRWKILGVQIWPNPAVRYTYQNELNYLKDWLTNRSIWMNNQLSSRPELLSWKNPVNINSNNEAITLTHNEFFSSLIPVDSVRFISLSNELSIVNYADSVELFSFSSKVKNFIGIAYHQGEIIDFSPTYSIGGAVTTIDEDASIKELPTEYILSQNYPNPFNPVTTIKYAIPTSEFGHRNSQVVSLRIYDILGREVATLVNKQQKPGIYKVDWNAGQLNSGVYFYKLTSGRSQLIKKMMLVK